MAGHKVIIIMSGKLDPLPQLAYLKLSASDGHREGEESSGEPWLPYYKVHSAAKDLDFGQLYSDCSC